jgi:hypothetical protein
MDNEDSFKEKCCAFSAKLTLLLLLLVILTCNRPPTLELVGEEPSRGGRAERAGM